MKSQKKVKRAIIAAAGLGTRFLPATNSVPKELFPIIDKPVIQILVEDCVNAGIEEIILVISDEKESIRNHFNVEPKLKRILMSDKKINLVASLSDISSKVSFRVIKQNELKGLGDAVAIAWRDYKKESVVVLSGDDIISSEISSVKQLLEKYYEVGSPILALIKVPDENITKYGVIAGQRIYDRLWKINHIIEKPTINKAPSDMAVMVKYVLSPDLFEIISNLKPVRGKREVYITDGLEKYIMNGGNIYGYEVLGKYFDCGDKTGLVKAIIHFGLNNSDTRVELRKYLKSIEI